MSFAAVKVVNSVDDSVVLPLVEIKLYTYPISGREIGRPGEFDLQHPARVARFVQAVPCTLSGPERCVVLPQV